MFNFMSHMRCEANKKTRLLHENYFFPALPESVALAEVALGYKLPTQLARFYKEVGWGQLQTGENDQTSDFNYVASPEELVALAHGTSDWLMPHSELEPSTLPFFQRDVDLLLCLHPKSDNPNAVYWMWGQDMPHGGRICDSLIEFFERLVIDPNWFNPADA